MRIALIRKKYTFHGGAETHMQKLAEVLASKGHEVHIFAAKWDAPVKREKIFFHKVPIVKFGPVVRDLSFALSSYIMLRKHRLFLDIIQSHDKTLYQDIYFAGDGCHIEWLKKRRLHSGFFTKLSIFLNPYHRLVLALERAIFKGHRFKKVVAISEMVKKEIMDNYGVDPKDIEVIYHGIDMDRLRMENRKLFRDEVRKQYSLNDDEQLVLFVGSGFERKGLAYFLKAVEMCRLPLTAMIVGKGPFDRYKHLIRHQKVIYCGPQPDVHKYYAAADLCVLPGMYEPFGLVHLEALARGLPVISTRRSGGSELVHDNINGFVVNDPEEIESIAEKIAAALDKDRYPAMGKNAAISVEDYTFDRHVEKLIDTYLSVNQAF